MVLVFPSAYHQGLARDRCPKRVWGYKKEKKKKRERNDFPDEGTEIQRSNGACPRSVAELRPEPTFPDIPSGPFETELV